jgi:hypothetical protein
LQYVCLLVNIVLLLKRTARGVCPSEDELEMDGNDDGSQDYEPPHVVRLPHARKPKPNTDVPIVVTHVQNVRAIYAVPVENLLATRKLGTELSSVFVL